MRSKVKAQPSIKTSALISLGAAAGAALSVLTLYTDGSNAIDGFIFTEAEAADLATQSKLDNFRQQIDILLLKLAHSNDEQRQQEIKQQIIYYQRQVRYLQCINDPMMGREECIQQ